MTKRVLVLGGGIGGLEAAIEARRQGLETLLVSDRDYLWLYPVSIWVATGERKPEQVRLSLKEAARIHGFKLVVDPVSAVRREGGEVSLDSGATLLRGGDYDHLILALGGGKADPAGREHTLTVCGKPEEADKIHNRLLELAESGGGSVAVGFGGNPKDPSAVRGGPAFELMFNIDHWLRGRGLRDKFNLYFFAPMANPGVRMGEKAAAAAQRMLAGKGVKTVFGKKIVRFESGAVVFEDDSRIEAGLTVFLAAGAGHPALKESGLPLNEAGFVVTDESCRVPGRPGVWAVGDAAALLGPEWRAKQGHIAEVMARTAVRNLAAPEGAKPESYVEAVNILCVMDAGNGAALVYRDDRRGWMVLLPLVGHWLKKAWGWYYRMSKFKRIPRLPGL